MVRWQALLQRRALRRFFFDHRAEGDQSVESGLRQGYGGFNARILLESGLLRGLVTELGEFVKLDARILLLEARLHLVANRTPHLFSALLELKIDCAFFMASSLQNMQQSFINLLTFSVSMLSRRLARTPERQPLKLVYCINCEIF